MIRRIYPTRDTFITNDVRNKQRATGSNVGAAESLEVFKRPGIPGVIGLLGSSSLSRILINFDTSPFTELIAMGQLNADPTYRLHLSHKTSAETLPFSFDLNIYPMQNPWDEGRGLDVEGLRDIGLANWDKASSTSFWDHPGGDYYNVGFYTSSMHFDTGEEDLDVDLTPMAIGWVTDAFGNYGAMIKFTDSSESDLDYTNLYTKKFYSRTTDFIDRMPYLELRGDDFLGDDRKNMHWSRTGSLVVYNVVNGDLSPLASLPTVTISDASGTLLSLTSSFSGRVGIYSASFALPSASYSGSQFFDSWNVSSTDIYDGSFSFLKEGPSSNVGYPRQVARVKNARSEYTTDETVRFEVSFKDHPISLPVMSTASQDIKVSIAERAYFAIENDSTRQRVVDFLTGSNVTRLSYDETGNYFNFAMSNLHAGNVYRLLFLVDRVGQQQIIDPLTKFKVV